MSAQKSFRLLLVGFIALAGVSTVHAAQDFATPQFAQQWQQGESIVANFWGPLALAKGGQQEPYADAPGGSRLVQYFDKGRMELTGNAVTNGLLATEMVTGQVQVGDTSFQARPAPAIPIAGDLSNSGPTYAQLGTAAKALIDPAPRRTGTASLAFVTTAGTIQETNMPSSDDITSTAYDDATKHNVARAFADYRARAGVQTIGLAISEPFRANVTLGGIAKTVLIQIFERRVLTYTAANDPAFRVEMGNTGLHYYAWRYGTAPPSVAPPPTTLRAITLADDGQALNVAVGTSFALALPSDYDWQVQIADESVVSRDTTAAVPANSQGVFVAKSVGQTTLTAIGDPACARVVPRCAAPTRLFHLQISVISP